MKWRDMMPAALRGSEPVRRTKKKKKAAPLVPESDIARLLMRTPRPLIHPGAKLIVVFSAKSACTNVVVWLLNHLGHARAAADYHPWPHRYRGDVYYSSQLYREALAQDLSGFAVLRVMRDPFDRAASSYRHALNTGYADKEIAGLLKRSDIRARGYSFKEFIDLLERSDLRKCNIHHRIQRHPVEDALPVRYLINISTQDLYAGLRAVEEDLDLPRTDFDALKLFHRDSGRKAARRTDATDAYAERFTHRDARHGPWPLGAGLLTAAARRRLAPLYSVDIESYLQPPDGPYRRAKPAGPGAERVRGSA